jgi:hypothetical protein
VEDSELTVLMDALDEAMAQAIGSLQRHFAAEPAAAAAGIAG